MKIGIIGAMDAEIEYILSKMEGKKETGKAGLLFTEGTIGTTDAVVVKCGVGKVNAALCTQILIDCFGITHLLNTGIAGSLNNDINIGDVVVSTDAVMHDMDAAVFGYAPGKPRAWACRASRRMKHSERSSPMRFTEPLRILPCLKEGSPPVISSFQTAQSKRESAACSMRNARKWKGRRLPSAHL